MSSQRVPRRNYEAILGAVSAGVFLLLVGSLFIFHPNLYNNLVSFFSHFTTASPFGSNSITLPIPTRVAAHGDVYTAAEQFSLAWGVFLAAALVGRFALNSPTRKKAENVSDLIFWFGAAYLIQSWLIEQAKWFEFWALIVMLIGVTLVARAIYLASASAIRPRT